MKSVDDVLADLEQVGAVGGVMKAPQIPGAVVTEVEIEKGPPSVILRDLRGDRTIEALDAAVRHLDAAVGELQGLRKSLVRLREVWEPVEDAKTTYDLALETPETILSAPEGLEVPSTAPTPQGPSEGVQGVDEEALARAREAARQKILGGDLAEEERARMEAEDNIPFVGMERALPPDRGPEETTIGTVGETKPSFPLEG